MAHLEVQLSLQEDLRNKHQVIFQMYLRDISAIQSLYEDKKMNPPRPRNTPLVAGCIMWARQLQRQIEGPMHE